MVHRGKKLFFALFSTLWIKHSFAVPAWHRWESCKEKASLLLIKIWRARRAKSEVLNIHYVHFPRKVPIFRAGKNAEFALQHPIIFGVLASPWTILTTEKRKFAFSWEMKVSLDTLKVCWKKKKKKKTLCCWSESKRCLWKKHAYYTSSIYTTNH